MIQCFYHPKGGIAVILVGGMDFNREQQSVCVCYDVPFASIYFFRTSTPLLSPPTRVVLTLWLSIKPALGDTLRPCFWRHCARKTSWISSIVPSSFHLEQ
jgi:hypothetical protein